MEGLPKNWDGTVRSRVELMIDTSQTESDFGMFSSGAGSGLISWVAMVFSVHNKTGRRPFVAFGSEGSME